jgi:hypothetical protein
MRLAGRSRQLLQSSCTNWRDGFTQFEDAIAKTGDDVVVREAVDGVDDVRSPAEPVGAAGPDAALSAT